MNTRFLVSYVVGTFLVFPIVVYHVVEDEVKRRKKKRPVQKISPLCRKKVILSGKATDNRRHCGHSQENVRKKR